MKYFLPIAFYIVCFCQQINEGILPFWVVWHVGQGQCVSYVDSHACYHFDAGGEFFDYEKFRKYCKNKSNIFSFSHWDWDHIGLVRKLARAVLSSCILYPPNGPSSSYKKQFLSVLPSCGSISNVPFHVYSPKGPIKTSNNWSRVFFNSYVIIPGDASKKTDQKWLPILSSLFNEKNQYLILGHHGSKNSTSKKLVEFLKKGGTAISSARKKRYGHPHPFISKFLRRNGVNLLSTEDFGHIHFQAKNYQIHRNFMETQK